MTTLSELQVPRLGECRFDSPLGKYVAGRRTNEHYVDEDDRVLFDDTVELLRARRLPARPSSRPSNRAAPGAGSSSSPAPRGSASSPAAASAPASTTSSAGSSSSSTRTTRVDDVVGFRHGFAGLVPGLGPAPVALTPDTVATINEQGGTDPRQLARAPRTPR